MRPVALWLACLLGCGGEPGPGVEISADPRHNVLVIDDGFDPGASALAGRVAARYTVTCTGDDPTEVIPRPGGMPEKRRAAVLAALQFRDRRCNLRLGIDPKPDPLADISTYRPAWNRLVEGSLPPDGVFTDAQVRAIARGQQLARGRYHGTATAGIIAHQNPDVRLVLVEERIGSDPEEGMFTCLEQPQLDEVVALFSDPEVRRAYLERPDSLVEEALADLKARYRIGLVNESFGFVSRQAVEDGLAAAGCPAVELRPYFALRGQLELERAQTHPPPETLLMKSAGNDGSRVTGAEDLVECAGAAGPRLMVGAYALDGRLAAFTNDGPCVDVYTPGVDVITHLPGEWLMPLDGTSFSAPLLVRAISLENGPFSPAEARAAVLAARDDRARIAIDRFPRELFYDPGKAVSRWALRVEPRPSRRQLAEVFSLLRLGQP